MRRKRSVAWVPMLGLLCVFGACRHDKEGNTYAPPPPPEVIVANPVEREVTSYLTYTGVIEASQTVELRARVQGFLESVNFSPGQRVKKGDVLFVIDKRQYAASVEQARASVAAQEAALLGAENDARLARELADQRAGPEIDAIIKAARRDVVAADLAQAKAMLTEALLNLEYCDVVAPIDGRITDNYVDIGNLVGRGETTLLAEIVQTAPVYVSVNVSEADVLKVRREREAAGTLGGTEPGQIAPGVWRPAELSLADRDEFMFKGRVDYVDPKMDPVTATLRLRTMYENADEVLLPGLFARVRFPMATTRSLVVPEAALLSDQLGRFAMVVNDKDEVVQKRVKIGALDGSMRVVEEGLTAQDRVIVLGVLKARPGSKVSPKMQEPAAQGR
ncbi:MAG: efflux RND transporter periplasmic adaptor subunit [Phycisphaeraceae bacterium]|nr:efflux RND transporter periplasmic adaptor subunit [Phycisphaeraceae bacterium]MBX3368646.1 efflux RND transporter periplasmic adaptor subunit [Phycisphaeraceae bacterium]